jgi:predicted HTH transcriptional regulator
VNNDLLNEHSWYFHNTLVRANCENLSKGIHKTDLYLVRFLQNLLHQENHLLKNREMHIHYVPPADDTAKSQIDTVNDTVFDLIKQNNKITAGEISEWLKISLSTVKTKVKKFKEKERIERIGSDKTGCWKIIE